MIELFRLRIPKTYVFPTQYYVWETSVTNQVESWKDRVKCFLETHHLKDLDRIDGEPMELEWKNFPGFTTLGILDEIQKVMGELQCEPENFTDKIIFMSMFKRLCVGRKRKHREMYSEFH